MGKYTPPRPGFTIHDLGMFRVKSVPPWDPSQGRPNQICVAKMPQNFLIRTETEKLPTYLVPYELKFRSTFDAAKILNSIAYAF